jgi:predicted permease
MAGLLTDVRFSLRALTRAPGFVVLSAICLGIGIGASVMTFTVLDRALLQPLGSVDPDGLVAVGEVRTTVPDQWWPVSLENFNDWQSAIDDDAELSAFRGRGFDVSSNGEDIRVEGAQIARNLFSVFGIVPILGPGLSESDDSVSSQSVVLISETLWRQRLGGDRALIGQVVAIDGSPHVVVGVMPTLLDVGMPTALRAAQVFVPLRGDVLPPPRDDRSFSVIGRLAPEVDVERFTARLDSIVTELAARYPENDGWSVRVGSMGAGPLTSVEPTLLISMVAAALVLLIGCANVANLTLARSIRRRHEFGIRATVGASGLRIARQLLVESLIVASLGAALGLVMAMAGLDVIAVAYSTDSLAPAALPIDGSTFAFVIGLTLITTLAFGLYPAVETARGAIRVQISESGAGTTIAKSRKTLRESLVIGQVAASMVLLIGAALLAQSFMNILALERGVETSTVTSIRVQALDDALDTGDVTRNVQAVLDALESIPGVETAATGGWVLPLRGGGFRSGVNTQTMSDLDTGPAVAYTGISDDFFDTLGIPILLGQALDQNVRRPDLAVINSAMAELLWPGQNPVGQQFLLDTESDRGWVTVAGVSGNFLTWDSNRDEALPTAYFDVRTFDAYPIFYFIRKREADITVSSQAIHRAVDTLGVPLQRTVITPMEQVAWDPFWRQRIFSLWFVAFGAAALTLTAIGIYGVLAYLVRQRLPEIGIRMALGAGRYRMLLMVLRQGTAFAGIGIIVGLGGAWLLARSMRGLLFGVEPLDPALFVVVTMGLAFVATTASVLPALRASRVEPVKALRSD